MIYLLGNNIASVASGVAGTESTDDVLGIGHDREVRMDICVLKQSTGRNAAIVDQICMLRYSHTGTSHSTPSTSVSQQQMPWCVMFPVHRSILARRSVFAAVSLTFEPIRDRRFAWRETPQNFPARFLQLRLHFWAAPPPIPDNVGNGRRTTDERDSGRFDYQMPPQQRLPPHQQQQKLVWVYQGRRPHVAVLEEKGLFFSRIRWRSDGQVAEVTNDRIQFNHTGLNAFDSSPEQPQRRRRNRSNRPAVEAAIIATTRGKNEVASRRRRNEVDAHDAATANSSNNDNTKNNGRGWIAPPNDDASSSSFTHTSQEENNNDKNQNKTNRYDEDDDASSCSSFFSSQEQQQVMVEVDSSFSSDDDDEPLSALLLPKKKKKTGRQTKQYQRKKVDEKKRPSGTTTTNNKNQRRKINNSWKESNDDDDDMEYDDYDTEDDRPLLSLQQRWRSSSSSSLPPFFCRGSAAALDHHDNDDDKTNRKKCKKNPTTTKHKSKDILKTKTTTKIVTSAKVVYKEDDDDECHESSSPESDPDDDEFVPTGQRDAARQRQVVVVANNNNSNKETPPPQQHHTNSTTIQANQTKIEKKMANNKVHHYDEFFHHQHPPQDAPSSSSSPPPPHGQTTDDIASASGQQQVKALLFLSSSPLHISKKRQRSPAPPEMAMMKASISSSPPPLPDDHRHVAGDNHKSNGVVVSIVPATGTENDLNNNSHDDHRQQQQQQQQQRPDDDANNHHEGDQTKKTVQRASLQKIFQRDRQRQATIVCWNEPAVPSSLSIVVAAGTAESTTVNNNRAQAAVARATTTASSSNGTSKKSEKAGHANAFCPTMMTMTTAAPSVSIKHALPCTKAVVAGRIGDDETSDGAPAASSPLSSSSPATTTYTGRSSAYVQNLAEMCHTILLDGRWQGLFRWEYEDDLSAVQALQRLYVPIPSPATLDFACRCILCQEDSPPPRQKNRPIVVAPNASDDARNHEPEKGCRLPSKEEDDDNELTSESLYLYSRLFYRKGPWFRIDNIYTSIIAPSSTSPETKTFSDTAGEDIDNGAEEPDPVGTNRHRDEPKTLDHHLSITLPQLFRRISKLMQMGLIRGFDNELECAVVCDNGSLFRADELAIINTKLGGRPGKTGKASLPSFSDRVAKQRTLFAHQSVPLIQQAGNVLLERFAVDLVARYSGNNSSSSKSKPQSPSKTDKEVLELVRRRLLKLRRELQSTSFPCFVRLNEKPALALRRVVRLYLCANSGPGEMRGTETNGWQSVNDCIYKTIRGEICPPCCHLWHKIRYPGLDYRFGLQSFCFMNSYVSVPVYEKSNTIKGTGSLVDERIFSSISDFRKWEKCAEIRANVDYLLCCYDRARKSVKTDPSGSLVESFDQLNISTVQGQRDLITLFAWGLSEPQKIALCRTVSAEIDRLPDELVHPARLLCAIGILCMHMLDAAIGQGSHDEPSTLSDRPWLRHLSWQACSAAAIVDIVPIFEQARLYELAARATWFLFHGSLPSPPRWSEDSSLIQSLLKPCYPRYSAGLLLSRRTRGKMFDRLLIDVRHLHLAHAKAADEITKCQAATAFRQQMQDFCVFHLRLGARSSTLGFSTLREITKRLKTPFATLLFNTQVVEAAMLGLREQKDFSLIEPATASTPAMKTNEWEPRVDSSVANSLTDATTAARGTRTAFVNYEDNDSEGKEVSQSRTMNVEEYAKDLYKTGRLPVSGDDECGGGGWEGWADDEGRVLRTLFRIICGAPIFGADFGCQRMMATDPMQSSIFLTPYQQTPFDLHVAHQKFENRSNAFSKLDSRRNSFYQRRYSLIVALRERLSRLNGQALSDAVFNSVTSRLHYLHQAGRKDPVLDRDLAQIRTLSAVAVGYGGVQLAAAFTCLFFDYRTYAGGLPDLQLFRTVQHDPETATVKVIDASWIGEQFSAQYQEAANANQLRELFFGDDDEYLGCSKDSSGRFVRKSSSGRGGASPRKCTVPSPNDIPPQLLLQHNGAPVQIQCLSVEVKSTNDVLSSRQVDWLNVLDQNGYSARVCKFHASAAAKAAVKKRKGGDKTREQQQQQPSTLDSP